MDRRQVGVRVRGNSVVIDFMFKGERCRETIYAKPTKTTLREISRKREVIKYEISMGTFDYAAHFPNSSRAISRSQNPGRLITVSEALKNWLISKQKRCQYSTLKSYNSIVYHHLVPEFGDIALANLTARRVQDWADGLMLSNKRINNIISPLRQMMEDAYRDYHIKENPLSRLKQLPTDFREPNPFTRSEVQLILQQLEGQSRNLIQFAFSSGLRTSELIALRWQDVDFHKDRIYIRVAVVERREKTTKTASGLRTVSLNDQSRESLKSQKIFSANEDRVFIDPKTGCPWRSDQIIRKRVWMPALKAAGLEYRNPYQTRHTYASMLLSRGENPLWVAQQMGHKDWGMIRKIYGRWIGDD